MAVQLLIGRDVHSTQTWLRPVNDGTGVYVVDLSADTATELTVPAWASIMILSAEVDFYVGTATFTIPSNTTFALSTANVELNAAGYYFAPGDYSSFWVRSESACHVTVAFYS